MPIFPRKYGALELKIRESLLARAVVLPIQRFIHASGVSSFGYRSIVGYGGNLEKIANRVEVSVDLKGNRISGPPPSFKQ
jgi:hypothetical protein